MRRRLVLVVGATTALVVVAFAIPLAALVRDVAHDRAITAAERDTAALAPVLAVTADDAGIVSAAVEQTATGADGRLSVFADSAQIGDQTPADDRALTLARERGAGFSRETSVGAEIYSPVITGDGQTTVVRARVPNELLEEGVRTAWAALAGVAVVLVLAGCVLADRLARSLTRDAAQLADTARALAGGSPDARARPSVVSEIGDVAAALNALADRINELRAAERERVADLSHRLRTPLTVLRLEADRGGIPEVAAGVDRLERDITQLIIDARRPLHDGLVDGSCDIAAVVRERARFWNALADDDGRSAAAVIPDGPLVVRLAEDEAVAAIDALLNNVFTHTPDGTGYSIEIVLTGDKARLSVHDDGPGVDDAAAAARGVSGGGSTGLGLDIVRHAARSAGGTVSVESDPAAGFTVHVDLPVITAG